jgi:hypothetical protein
LPSFDLHQHLWPEELISALSRRRERPRLRASRLELVDGDYEVDLEAHALERRLELLDRDGIDVACISLPPTLGCEVDPDLLEAYHEGIQALVAAAGGRLCALACGERRDGFVGACVGAQQLIDGVDDLVAELAGTGQFLFVHPGIPAHTCRGAPSWWTAVVDYPAQMQAAFIAWIAEAKSRHPGVPVVFALLAGGGPFQLERLSSRGASSVLHEDVYLDTASYGRRALELCLDAVGPRRLVYGSDTPVIDSRPTLRAVAELGDAVAEAVCRENPAVLLR